MKRISSLLLCLALAVTMLASCSSTLDELAVYTQIEPAVYDAPEPAEQEAQKSAEQTATELKTYRPRQ